MFIQEWSPAGFSALLWSEEQSMIRVQAPNPGRTASFLPLPSKIVCNLLQEYRHCCLPSCWRWEIGNYYYVKSWNGERARWQIVDIPIVQQWLTTLKKEDQRPPKGTHKVPSSARSKVFFKSTNHGKNGKNDMQLNTPNPGPRSHCTAPVFLSWFLQ
jgi:hypothetical protein